MSTPTRTYQQASLASRGFRRVVASLLILLPALMASEVFARNNIRDAFFAVYPDAVGTTIETVPSHLNHCGVCHFDFAGGGARNPYGLTVEAALPNFSSNPNGRRQAIQSVENQDADGDGFSALIEVTDTISFANTPTFPGLTPANVAGVTSVDVTEIQQHLVPSTGGDTTPPDVTIVAPNGGEVVVGNSATTVQWTANDASGVAAVDIHLSDDNGVTFKPIALGLSNTGSHTWFVANRPTTLSMVRVVATDNAFNKGQDDSDAVFTVESPPGGIVPTTLRDFDQPGSQPFEAGILNPPEACAACHGNYDSSVEPYFNWQGSMMAQASRDVLFLANMVIANQDAPDSGDMCLRCHFPRGWLQGRSVPTDGSQMLATDFSGVSCDFCHRLVDPIYDPTENPPEDQGILAALSFPASDFGNGTATIDPTGARRGPFLNAATGHPVLVSPFHREAALCGTCHDVSNPAFEKDGNGNYVPNAFDAPATDFSAHTIAPVERTYSEWFYSEYNTPGGVFAPEFGGNLDFVSTCQDCHMRDVTGEGCNFGTPPTRDDLPLHDITGGSTWLPGLLGTLFPGEVNETALQAGIDRARYMLQNATDLAVALEGSQLKVTITNNTGHKLPTGYPEGRRIWINVKFYDTGMALVSESGAYDPSTGVLGHDAEAKIYDIEPGLDEVTAPLVGVDPGPSLHFVLNNKVFKDNRIPPRGFTNAAYADFGGSPVAYSYADGQYWDDTLYTVPPGAASAEVTLYYQSTSKEFIEFLRDENTTDTQGQDLYDLWNNNGKCPPEIMQTTTVALGQCFADVDCDDGQFCNGSETCDLGTNTCQSGTDPSCDDLIDCTDDACDPSANSSAGVCVNTPNNINCTDSIDCTVDTCDQLGGPGTGCSFAAGHAACDDQIGCTDDACDQLAAPGTGCSNTPNAASCDDLIACTDDACDQLAGPGSGCSNAANDANCTDSIDCTLDACDQLVTPGSGCSYTPDHSFCDDLVACTADACDQLEASGTGCSHVADDANCDNNLFCDGFETCDTSQGCRSGEVPCTAECEHCVEDADSCELCILDPDGNGVMGTGDFSLFAPCFGACYTTGDSCLESNFDQDPSGCVGTSDFAAFVGCFGDTCGACVGCAGPGGGSLTANASTYSPLDSDLLRVQVITRRSASESDIAEALPLADTFFAVGDDMFVEIWTRIESADQFATAGLASAYVDLRFDRSRLEVIDIVASGAFGLFAEQSSMPTDGVLRAVGGCASLGSVGAENNGAWVRMATAIARTTSSGRANLSINASDDLHGFSRVGMFGNIGSSLIEFEGATVQIKKKYRGFGRR